MFVVVATKLTENHFQLPRAGLQVLLVPDGATCCAIPDGATCCAIPDGATCCAISDGALAFECATLMCARK
ncbi:MAG: hypothetical protein LKJ18_08800 [Ancrocorticia sp.]|nr:hypothetical protein [Ancrocorticia sp.]MCI2003000.1 hypothetical protein [Ancrocorticia sp.]